MTAVAEASAERPLQNLPSGWTWARLGDICDAINGRAFKSSEWRESGVPIVRIQNLKDPDAEFNYFVGELDDRHRVRHGDLLFAWSGTPGTSFGAHIWKGPDAALNQHIFNIKFDPNVLDARYFCLALNQNVSRYVTQAQGGVGLAHITKSKFLDSFIPLAPKPEQLELVAEIEKQFSRLDEAVANLKRVKASLKRYKAAVLKAAVEGRLVPNEAEIARREGRAYEPAHELLQQVLSKRRQPWQGRHREPSGAIDANTDGLPDGWCWCTIEQLAEVGTGATPSRSNASYWLDGDVAWVSSAVVNEPYVDAASEFVTRKALSETNLTLYPPGTLLVAMYGEGKTRGRCTELRIPATTNQAIAALQVDSRTRPYLKLFLEHNYEELRKVASGGVQPNLNLGIIRTVRVPLPPLAEQQRIVVEVDRCLSLVSDFERAVDLSELRAGRLRRAVLSVAIGEHS